VAALNGWTTSSPASAVYTLQAAAPTVNLASRAYNTPQQVSISDSMPDAVIWYTLDGSRPVPGAGSAIQYNATPIQINRTTTLETVATVPGWANSLPTARVYTLMAGGPTFSPRAGTYKVAQSVAISDSTPNAVIWYTTDGSSPVPGAGTATQYKGKSVAIIATTTLNAVAAVSGWSNSLIASAAYTIQ
jgi:hypothetical protein